MAHTISTGESSLVYSKALQTAFVDVAATRTLTWTSMNLIMTVDTYEGVEVCLFEKPLPNTTE